MSDLDTPEARARREAYYNLWCQCGHKFGNHSMFAGCLMCSCGVAREKAPCGGQAFCWCGEKALFGGLNSQTKNADYEYWCGKACGRHPDVDVRPLKDNGAHEYCECNWSKP